MTSGPGDTPLLTIVVIVYDMRREAPRTLASLSSDYQRGVTADDYEVLVVENGSPDPMSPADVTAFGPNFKYLRIDDASPSPAAAINGGVAQSTGDFVGIMIDGARLVSPGVVGTALAALTRFERPVVGTLGYHLGPDVQPRSVPLGYDRTAEDDLLHGIDWPDDGDRLFEISTIASSSSAGRLGRLVTKLSPTGRPDPRRRRVRLAEAIRSFGGLVESNLLFMSRELFVELGGFDERFDIPGGGFVNLDAYRRAADLPNSTLVTLAGEGSFHQVHGGTVTNLAEADVAVEVRRYREQFQEIRGEPFRRTTRLAMVVGSPAVDDRYDTVPMSVCLDPSRPTVRAIYATFVGLRRLRNRLSLVRRS